MALPLKRHTDGRINRAFPTTFINWPASYSYLAEMYDPTPRTSCIPASTTVTATITEPTPQFTAGEEYDFSKGSYGDSKKLLDPEGLLATQATIHMPSGFPLPYFYSMFPDQPALNCTFFPQGPAWGGFISSWTIATSTKYVS